MPTINYILLEIQKLPQTVFTSEELSQIFASLDEKLLRRRLSYYTKAGLLQRLRRSIYAKENYRPEELANKLYSPSYISFTTILEKASVVFQASSIIHSASYLSRSLTVDQHQLAYHCLKDEILLNLQGINQDNQSNLASPERAFTDTLYLFGQHHFDNLAVLDWEKVFRLAPLYQTKALSQRVNHQYKIYKNDHA